MMLNRLVRTVLFLWLLLGSSISVRAQSASSLGSKTAATNSVMDFSAAKFTPGVRTIGAGPNQLPSASGNTNVIFEVTDGTSASDCTVGSGSTRSLCASTGSVWVSVGGGSSSGASIQSLGTITTPPTLDGGNGTVKTIGAVLGANIASCAAIQNFVSGQILTLSLTQDGTGSRTLACAGLANLGTVSGQAGKNDKQTFVAVSASTLQAIAPMWCVDCPPALGLPGLTSGILNIKAAAIAGSNTLIFPAGTTDFSATGGTSQFVKQASSGGAFTVAQPSAFDLSNGTTGSGAICLATGSSCSSTASGLCWTVGGPAYTNAAGVIPAGATGATAFRGLIYSPNSPCINSTSTHFHYTTLAAASSGSNGFVAAYYNLALTSILCETTVATGAQITTAGTPETLTWASGANVSGGICTTTSPYLIVLTSNDTTFSIASVYDVVASQASLDQPGGTATGNTFAGYSAAAVSTGAGSAITLNANLSANTWTAFGFTVNILAVLSQR